MSGSSGSSKLSNRISSHLSTWGSSTLSDKNLIKMQKYQKHKTVINKGENNLHKVLQVYFLKALKKIICYSLFIFVEVISRKKVENNIKLVANLYSKMLTQLSK